MTDADAEARRLYREQRDWNAALAFWQAREAAASPTAESRAAIAHCLIELGRVAPGPAGAIAPALAAGPAPEPSVALIRARAYECLGAGDAERAAQLTRLLAALDPRMRRVYEGAILSPGAPDEFPEVAGGPPLRFQRDRPGEVDDVAVLARQRGRRVLLAIRQYRHTGRSLYLADFYRHFADSARGLGIETVALESHPPAAAAAEVPDALRAALADVDVAIVDDALASGASADPTVGPAILAVLEDAQRARGTKLVFTYPDSWHDALAPVVGAAARTADLIHVSHPGVLRRVSPRFTAKLWCYPPPIADPRGPDPAPVPRQLRASIAGRINWSNEARLAWWCEIARSGLPVDLHPTVYGHERSPVEYADLLSAYAVTINVTARANEIGILTGRTVEALLHDSLLLEQQSADTDYFLRPFEHYVPFSTLTELIARMRRVLDDAPLRERITRAGAAWARRYFSGAQFWARLFAMLYEGA